MRNTSRNKLALIGALVLALYSRQGFAEGAKPRPFVALEPQLLSSLANVFYNFDTLRAVYSHPRQGKNFTRDHRIMAYEDYLKELQRYGALAPQDPSRCLLSLDFVENATEDQEREPVRPGRYLFEKTDPCYPQPYTPKVDGPMGWDIPDAGGSLERGGTPSTSGDGKGTSTGGVGRNRGNGTPSGPGRERGD